MAGFLPAVDGASAAGTTRRYSTQRTPLRGGKDSRSVRNAGTSGHLDRQGRTSGSALHYEEGFLNPAVARLWLTSGPSMGSDGFTQALVAQRIRASDYGSEGREFESLQAR